MPDSTRVPQIHSFEPIPELITLFEQRNGHNNRIALNKLALSNVNGEQTLHLNKSLDASSLLVSSNIGGSSDALCQTVSTISIKPHHPGSILRRQEH